jgi:hypothetical protein
MRALEPVSRPMAGLPVLLEALCLGRQFVFAGLDQGDGVKAIGGRNAGEGLSGFRVDQLDVGRLDHPGRGVMNRTGEGSALLGEGRKAGQQRERKQTMAADR